jgi:predicted RNA-binding Zn-ribbon protein involved in translation (DUF1610 family)
MDDGWVCESCRSLNRPRTDRCYSCHQSRGATSATTASAPPAASQLFETHCNPELQRDVWTQLLMFEGMREARGMAQPCRQLRLARIEDLGRVDPTLPAGAPPSPLGGPGSWHERWTLDRCGEIVSYTVTFAPDPNGGTNLGARFPPEVKALRRADDPEGTAAEAPTAEIPASGQNDVLALGGAVTMACPACGTPRSGWSSHCRSCGLSFDELATAEFVEAASHGPGPLARLLYRRLPVLIPGLILLVVGLVVLLVAVALDPSLLAKLQR